MKPQVFTETDKYDSPFFKAVEVLAVSLSVSVAVLFFLEMYFCASVKLSNFFLTRPGSLLHSAELGDEYCLIKLATLLKVKKSKIFSSMNN